MNAAFPAPKHTMVYFLIHHGTNWNLYNMVNLAIYHVHHGVFPNLYYACPSLYAGVHYKKHNGTNGIQVHHGGHGVFSKYEYTMV